MDNSLPYNFRIYSSLLFVWVVRPKNNGIEISDPDVPKVVQNPGSGYFPL
jgi:hypothetical protein